MYRRVAVFLFNYLRIPLLLATVSADKLTMLAPRKIATGVELMKPGATPSPFPPILSFVWIRPFETPFFSPFSAVFSFFDKELTDPQSASI